MSLQIERYMARWHMVGSGEWGVDIGWLIKEQDTSAEFVRFGSFEALEAYLDYVAKEIVGRARSKLDTPDLSFEDAVALNCIQHCGNGDDSYSMLGFDPFEKWRELVFADDHGPNDLYNHFQDQAYDVGYEKKFFDGNHNNTDLKLLNNYLYLSKPSAAVKRAARRLGFSCHPEDGEYRFNVKDDDEGKGTDTG